MDQELSVMVSVPKEKNLFAKQKLFLAALTKKLGEAGLRVVDVDGSARLFEQSTDIRRLHGVLVVAFAQWEGSRPDKSKEKAVFPTEFNHMHIAIAVASSRPLLILKEKTLSERGALRPSMGCRTIKITRDLDPRWLDGTEFDKQFQLWLQEVRSQRRVFLAYCSKSAGTAAQIQLFLEKLGAVVINWAMDFRAGASILSEIEETSNRCSSGVFLFTEDDPLLGVQGGAAPRDNVVFEAGYFVSAKGSHRCLIIRQGEAKMPADLGGSIYVPLGKGADVSAIEGRLAAFLKGAN